MSEIDTAALRAAVRDPELTWPRLVQYVLALCDALDAVRDRADEATAKMRATRAERDEKVWYEQNAALIWKDRAEKAEEQVARVRALADHFERHYGPSLGIEIRAALDGD